MSEITLVRQNPVEVSEEHKAIARNVLFGIIDGLGEGGRRQWRRFFNRLMRLEPGEMVSVMTHQERLGWYHKKHMKLEQTLFEHQERFDNFKGFRNWLKVGAGHCQWYPGPKGGVFPVPDTISYTKMEQGEMETFHANVVEFLRTEHAGKTLWKHLAQPARIDMIESILAGFGEFA
jgi:hypothetical protein